jgi:predicted CopG family antitoxin
MSVKNTTTIKISRENWQRLNKMKEKPGEAFNDVVDRLLEQ